MPSRPTNLQDVINLVEAGSASAKQRQGMASAVRTVARALGHQPAEIEADLPALRRRLAKASAEAVGLSKGRWANVRSLFSKALELAGTSVRRRGKSEIAAEWRALLDPLSEQHRWRLGPLFRFLSEHGVSPATVTEDDLLAYRAVLMESSLRADPEGTWDGIVWIWNAEADRSLDWPQVLIPRPSRKDTYSLPWSAFSASLKQDVDAWLKRLAGDPLADEGPSRPVRAGTLTTRERQLRAVASALVAAGEPITAVRSLADLVQPDNLRRALTFLRDRNNGVASTNLTQLAQMMLSVARHHVKADKAAIDKLAVMAARLPKPRRGMNGKNRDRLLELRDPQARAALLHLPQTLRRAADRQRRPQQAALTASLAVAIELLLMAPIRVGNLAGLRLGTNLIRTGRRRYISIPEADVKNGVPLEFELTDTSDALLEWYLGQHRPALSGTTTDLLFPTTTGRMRSAAYLGTQISRVILRHTGLSVHPHLFRHLAAQLYLEANPGGYEVMRRVLGHKAMATTTNSYAGMEGPAAMRHFDETIDRLRQASPLSGGRRTRR
jgi:integrase